MKNAISAYFIDFYKIFKICTVMLRLIGFLNLEAFYYRGYIICLLSKINSRCEDLFWASILTLDSGTFLFPSSGINKDCITCKQFACRLCLAIQCQIAVRAFSPPTSFASRPECA